MDKLKTILGKVLTYLNRRQAAAQSTILWVLAILNFGSQDFWFFAIPAIILSGIQAIVDELRKNNEIK